MREPAEAYNRSFHSSMELAYLKTRIKFTTKCMSNSNKSKHNGTIKGMIKNLLTSQAKEIAFDTDNKVKKLQPWDVET